MEVLIFEPVLLVLRAYPPIVQGRRVELASRTSYLINGNFDPILEF